MKRRHQPTVNICQTQKQYKLQPDRTKRIVNAFFHFYKLSHDEVFIHFVTKGQIGKIHADYFNDPSPTDCISFPMDTDEEIGYKVLGEVFVCPAVAKEYAKTQNIDFQEEVDLYVVHGLLHLIGFDDLTNRDRKIMRQEETKFMNHLKSIK